MLERRPTRQRNTTMIMSREMRDSALLQVLAPESVIPYSEVPQTIIDRLKNIASTTLSSKILFSQQARILAKALNPNYKFAPSIPHSSDITAPIRHAICQGNWSMAGYKLPEVDCERESQSIVESVCQTFVCSLSQSTGIFTPIVKQFEKNQDKRHSHPRSFKG